MVGRTDAATGAVGRARRDAARRDGLWGRLVAGEAGPARGALAHRAAARDGATEPPTGAIQRAWIGAQAVDAGEAREALAHAAVAADARACAVIHASREGTRGTDDARAVTTGRACRTKAHAIRADAVARAAVRADGRDGARDAIPARRTDARRLAMHVQLTHAVARALERTGRARFDIEAKQGRRILRRQCSPHTGGAPGAGVTDGTFACAALAHAVARAIGGLARRVVGAVDAEPTGGTDAHPSPAHAVARAKGRALPHPQTEANGREREARVHGARVGRTAAAVRA